MNLYRKAIVSAIGGVCLGLTTPNAQACSCSTIPVEASAIVGVVGTGSTAIVTALEMGFRKTATQIEASDIALTKALETQFEFLASEIKRAVLEEQPKVMATIEQRLNEVSPARHATNECSYMDRAGDSVVADTILGFQQDALGKAVVNYNEMTSNYPEGVNAPAAFSAQANRLLQQRPGVKDAPIKLITSPDKVGAMSEEDVQDASHAINLAMNPSPPAKIQAPVSPADIQVNVQADLHNLRASIAQGIAQDILAYEAPLLGVDQDSWFADLLKRSAPDDYEAFLSGERKVSKTDMLRLMATHRMKDPVTSAMTSAKEKEGLLKDLAMVKADHLVLDYELWRMDRYQALLMSQMVASQVRSERSGGR